jgi:hypothetical protein
LLGDQLDDLAGDGKERPVSRDRGVRAPHWITRYLSDHGWPHAEATGSGRRGTDIQGTPGIVWEVKTAREFRPGEWVRQARTHAWADQVPVVVYLPDRVGERTPEAAMCILPLPVLTGLLRAAGYGSDLLEGSRMQ